MNWASQLPEVVVGVPIHLIRISGLVAQVRMDSYVGYVGLSGYEIRCTGEDEWREMSRLGGVYIVKDYSRLSFGIRRAIWRLRRGCEIWVGSCI